MLKVKKKRREGEQQPLGQMLGNYDLVLVETVILVHVKFFTQNPLVMRLGWAGPSSF